MINGIPLLAAFQVNHIDIAPSHAAVMMGVTNGFANLCGIGAPYVAGVIINDGVGTLFVKLFICYIHTQSLFIREKMHLGKFGSLEADFLYICYNLCH